MRQKAVETAFDLAARNYDLGHLERDVTAMAETLAPMLIGFSRKVGDERKQIYEHSSLIIDSTSITAAAECGPENH